MRRLRRLQLACRRARSPRPSRSPRALDPLRRAPAHRHRTAVDPARWSRFLRLQEALARRLHERRPRPAHLPRTTRGAGASSAQEAGELLRRVRSRRVLAPSRRATAASSHRGGHRDHGNAAMCAPVRGSPACPRTGTSRHRRVHRRSATRRCLAEQTDQARLPRRSPCPEKTATSASVLPLGRTPKARTPRRCPALRPLRWSAAPVDVRQRSVRHPEDPPPPQPACRTAGARSGKGAAATLGALRPFLNGPWFTVLARP